MLSRKKIKIFPEIQLRRCLPLHCSQQQRKNTNNRGCFKKLDITTKQNIVSSPGRNLFIFIDTGKKFTVYENKVPTH